MGRGNYRPPGENEGRPNESIFVDTSTWGDYEDFVVREDDLFCVVKRSLPKSFRWVEGYRSHGNQRYYVVMENDFCELIFQPDDYYYVVAFVAKEKTKGWYRNWTRTAKKVFTNIHYSGFDTLVKTGPWTTAIWHPKAGYSSFGKNYKPFEKVGVSNAYNKYVSKIG